MKEQDWRMMQLPNGLRLVMETKEERKAILVKMVATTQLTEDERTNMEWIDLYLIRIEIGFFKNFK